MLARIGKHLIPGYSIFHVGETEDKFTVEFLVGSDPKFVNVPKSEETRTLAEIQKHINNVVNPSNMVLHS